LNEEKAGERPSKSARKRELEALQALAERMAALSDAELARLHVDKPLRDAVALVRPMRPSSARNRQIRHCVRFMDADDLAEVRAYLDDRQSNKVAVNREFHEIERWRDRLAEQGDGALWALFDAYPQLDRQRIRQLSRDAWREQQTGSPAGAGRKLFRALRAALSEQTRNN
jgi:ribosome-associated protein